MQDYFSHKMVLSKIVYNLVTKVHTFRHICSVVILAIFSWNVRVIFINLLIAYHQVALMGEQHR